MLNAIFRPVSEKVCEINVESTIGCEPLRERREGNYPCFRELGRAMLGLGIAAAGIERAATVSSTCTRLEPSLVLLTKNVRVN